MHFSIPESLELYSEASTGYTGFKIYINGIRHCICRYKNLHSLHEELRRCCIEIGVPVPVFPPKRLLPLTLSQLESRRYALERYLQQVGQHSKLAKLEVLEKFLLKSQLETAEMDGVISECDDSTSRDPMEVTLMNMNKIQLNSCLVADNTHVLLKKVCQLLDLPEYLESYFCLYLVRFDKKDKLVLLRRLMNFESPYLSRLQYGLHCQILLRRSYWNPRYDLDLMENTTALNLMYMETLSDIEREWIIAQPQDVYTKLRSLQEHGLKKEYLELARQLPRYGCLQFPAAIVDYPDPQTEAIVSIGNAELSLRTTNGAKKTFETKFRVTRMRCWRVTAVHTKDTKNCAMNLQLSFEYLMSKQNMRWVTILSEHAMLMSVCLQDMVDELLQSNETPSTQSGADVSDSPSSTSTRTEAFNDISYRPEGSQVSSSHSNYTLSGEANDNLNSNQSSCNAVHIHLVPQSRSTEHPKVPASKSYSSVFFRKAQKSVKNEAFEGIGDDDL